MSACAFNNPIRWGHGDLTALIADVKSGLSLREAAQRQGRGVSAGDCDRALWIKLGRSVEETCDILNGWERA